MDKRIVISKSYMVFGVKGVSCMTSALQGEGGIKDRQTKEGRLRELYSMNKFQMRRIRGSGSKKNHKILRSSHMEAPFPYLRMPRSSTSVQE